jgi:hypothetical protein
MQNDSNPNFNAYHYIIVGVLGFFAGSLGGFLLCIATCRPGDDTFLPLWVLCGGIVVAAGLPMLLRASSR